jgi:hypothetical protein
LQIVASTTLISLCGTIFKSAQLDSYNQLNANKADQQQDRSEPRTEQDSSETRTEQQDSSEARKERE